MAKMKINSRDPLDGLVKPGLMTCLQDLSGKIGAVPNKTARLIWEKAARELVTITFRRERLKESDDDLIFPEADMRKLSRLCLQNIDILHFMINGAVALSVAAPLSRVTPYPWLKTLAARALGQYYFPERISETDEEFLNYLRAALNDELSEMDAQIADNVFGAVLLKYKYDRWREKFLAEFHKVLAELKKAAELLSDSDLSQYDNLTPLFRKARLSRSRVIRALKDIRLLIENIKVEPLPGNDSRAEAAKRFLDDFRENARIAANPSSPRFFGALKRLSESADELNDFLRFMLAPPRFNETAAREILTRIEPQLLKQDQLIAEAEIASVAAGELEIEKAPFLSCVIPALRGEKEFDVETFYALEDIKSDNVYSSRFVRKMREGGYSLKSDVKKEGGEGPNDAGSGDKAPEDENNADDGDSPKEETCSGQDSPDTTGETDARSEEEENLFESGEKGEGGESSENFLEATPDDAGENDAIAEAKSGDESGKAGDAEVVEEVVEKRAEESEAGKDEAEEYEFRPAPEKTPLSPGAKTLDVIRYLAQTEADSEPAPDASELRDRYYACLKERDFVSLYGLSSEMREPPAPPRLVKLLGLGAVFSPEFSELIPELDALYAEVSENFDTLDENAFLLLATALLRPALMNPTQNMATVASFLGHALKRFELTPFFRELENFIGKGVPVDITLFAGQNPKILFEKRKAALLEKTDALLRAAKEGKLLYQAASAAKKYLFGPKGRAGRVLELCRNGELCEETETFAREICDDKAADALINEAANKYTSKNLVGPARARLRENIREAAKLAREWHELYAVNDGAEKNYSENELRKIIAASPADPGRLRATPEGDLFADQLEALRAYASKKLVGEGVSPGVDLKLWRLRVPYMNRDGRVTLAGLARAIRDGSTRDKRKIAASLAVWLAKGYLAECEEFLRHYPEYADEKPDFSLYDEELLAREETLGDYLAASRQLWESEFAKTVEDVKNLIVECEFRGVVSSPKQTDFSQRLDEIKSKYADAIPGVTGTGELLKIAAELRKLEKEKKEALEPRLARLKNENNLSQHALTQLAEAERNLENGMINLAEDIVEAINAHLAGGKLGTYSSNDVANDDTARRFYQKLERGAFKAPQNSEWRRIGALLRKYATDGAAKSALTGLVSGFLRDTLGFSINREQSPLVESPGGKRNWRYLRYESAQIEGPLPQWGKTPARHTVLVGTDVTAEEIVRLLGERGNEERVVVIVTDPLSKEERVRILSHPSAKKFAPLIIDQNLCAFLEEEKPENRRNALFRVCLAGASVIPYTDVAGGVPAEMFYGRENEINDVLEPAGPCIIYGGRQLGKSAIQVHVKNGVHPGVKVLRHSMNNHETSMLNAVRNECADADIMSKQVNLENVPRYIKEWLDKNPGERILMLLDECDKVLDRDRENNFAEISQLRSLMEDTNRRFKVVLAGLHSVQRFSQIPNNPFAHFSGDICVGPLAASAAYDLLTVPLSILGITFETPLLARLVLNHCGYQPKLIQVFCIELLKVFRDQKRKAPFRVIDRQTMVDIYKSHNMREVITKCFDWTLEMDERYKVIGYVLGIYKNEELTSRELLTLLRYYWPAAFGATGETEERAGASVNTLQSLLREMVGLGLVSDINGRYRLRTPGVVELMGGEAAIEDKLLDFANRPYQPAGNPDNIRVNGADIFVASQYNLLSEKTNHFYWISGSRALGADKVPDVLASLGKIHNIKVFEVKGVDPQDLLAAIRKKYEAVSEGGVLCYFDADDVPFLDRFMEPAIKWLDNLRAGKKFVKIVVLVKPAALYELFKSSAADKYAACHIQLSPWTTEGVREWRKENAVPEIAPEDIMAQSRGWPLLTSDLLGKIAPRELSLEDLIGQNFGPLADALRLFYELGGADERPDMTEIAEVVFELASGKFNDAWETLAALESLRVLGALREDAAGYHIDAVASRLVSGISA